MLVTVKPPHSAQLDPAYCWAWWQLGMLMPYERSPSAPALPKQLKAFFTRSNHSFPPEFSGWGHAYHRVIRLIIISERKALKTMLNGATSATKLCAQLNPPQKPISWT